MRRQGERPELIRWRLCGTSKTWSFVPQRSDKTFDVPQCPSRVNGRQDRCRPRRGPESASQGTLRTAIRQVSRPVLCRRAGAIVALDDRSPRWIDFVFGDEPFVPVSWGDVATAFHSTGAGNITVYFRPTKLLRSANTLGKLFGPLLRSRIGQRGLAAIVRRLPEGPNQAERIGHHSTVWAEAMDSLGRSSKQFYPHPIPTTSRRTARWKSPQESPRCRFHWA